MTETTPGGKRDWAGGAKSLALGWGLPIAVPVAAAPLAGLAKTGHRLIHAPNPRAHSPKRPHPPRHSAEAETKSPFLVKADTESRQNTEFFNSLSHKRKSGLLVSAPGQFP